MHSFKQYNVLDMDNYRSPRESMNQHTVSGYKNPPNYVQHMFPAGQTEMIKRFFAYFARQERSHAAQSSYLEVDALV